MWDDLSKCYLFPALRKRLIIATFLVPLLSHPSFCLDTISPVALDAIIQCFSNHSNFIQHPLSVMTKQFQNSMGIDGQIFVDLEYFQASASNVTAIRGETAMLVCKVINIGDKAVGEFYHDYDDDDDNDDIYIMMNCMSVCHVFAYFAFPLPS